LYDACVYVAVVDSKGQAAIIRSEVSRTMRTLEEINDYTDI
jgi:hypothetical protein